MKARIRCAFLAVAIVALTFGATASADRPAKKRPLSDFLNTQGESMPFVVEIR
jgi:hypothetical protein